MRPYKTVAGKTRRTYQVQFHRNAGLKCFGYLQIGDAILAECSISYKTATNGARLFGILQEHSQRRVPRRMKLSDYRTSSSVLYFSLYCTNSCKHRRRKVLSWRYLLAFSTLLEILLGSSTNICCRFYDDCNAD